MHRRDTKPYRHSELQGSLRWAGLHNTPDKCAHPAEILQNAAEIFCGANAEIIALAGFNHDFMKILCCLRAADFHFNALFLSHPDIIAMLGSKSAEHLILCFALHIRAENKTR